MLSPFTVKLLKILPEGLLVTAAKKITNNYLKKFARLHIEGFEELEQYGGPFIFICNHLSNSDGIVLNKLLKEKYDPYFVAGVKLTNDPITNVGTKMVKNIPVKPNTADKEAITTMVKTVKSGENLLIFPEGTRSRKGAMIEGKKGILLLARMTKAKIIPIGMSGTDKLLPIDEGGNMGSETWHEADVTVKFGKPVELPKRIKEEDKHEYDNKCMYILMRSIAELLPEEYRGVYK